jgi:REP element-mobilizing transposase RayT
MPNNKAVHNRQSIRLVGFDYSQEGSYFITICTHNRKSLFGEIFKEQMVMNRVGDIVYQEWLKIPNRFQGIQLGLFVVMPNHIHGIISILKSIPGQTIGNIIGAFKSLSANEYIRLMKMNVKPVEKLWQRNYYEHIIRDD